MLFTSNTKRHILNAIRNGAELIVSYSASGACDGCAQIVGIDLAHKGKRLTLTHWEPRPGIPAWADCETQRMANLTEWIDLTDSPDLLQRWVSHQREIYEFKSLPTPKWVTEQWASPVSATDDCIDW